jgi:YVTN family beta-propeller protein
MNFPNAQLVLICASIVLSSAVDSGAQGPPLALETKISLGAVEGRLDHLAVDLEHMRLYVAELGNNSLGVVDLKTQAAMATIGDLSEPQGVAYLAAQNAVYVASGGDGSVAVFNGDDLALAKTIALGTDADNIRIDAVSGHVLVGYGASLAEIDPTSGTVVSDIPLPGHPEGFQVERNGSRVFINIPDTQEIAVVHRGERKVIANWSVKPSDANFPMALDEERQQLVSVFRAPPRLRAFALADGTEQANVGICADADDVFTDIKRQLVYVICGAGEVDILKIDGFAPVARVPTSTGSRTGLFVPELDRLFVAVRATYSEPAAIWVFRPPSL